MKRFLVLDALRIVLALCVTIGHMGTFPLFGPVGAQLELLNFLAQGWRTVIFGPPAVIAFFTISGFCIHYPFAVRNKTCTVWRFYARRYLRIVIPVVCAAGLFKLVDPATQILGKDSIFWHSALWSIICEEIYYAFYPLLNRLGRRTGWTVIIVASLIPAFLVCWRFFPSVEWQDMGIAATTVTLFPVWLSGCYLAQNVSSLMSVYRPLKIWAVRFAMWAVMWGMLILHFHTAIHQTVSGLFVGVACYFWIRAEICYYRNRRPWPLLVWGGKWSYSLYLVHFAVITAMLRGKYFSLDSELGWIAVLGLILSCSYAFYLVIERPSHRLARKIKLTQDEADSRSALQSI